LGEESRVHLVGGAVRDLLLGGAPPDLDLVVEDDVAVVVARLGVPAREHDRFGTATIVLEGFTYDIARARVESYPFPGALPEVRPASLSEDLLRRDFTVNAIAIALGGPEAGALAAAPRALKDLDRRVLRVLHDHSFIDDPTRLLRLARYAARLGFEIEPHTAELAQMAVQGGALKTVSGPRIGTELRLLAREPDPVAALLALQPLGIEEFPLDDPALARRALELLPADGRPDLLVLALAVPGGPGFLDGLAFDGRDRERILAARRAEQLAQELGAASTPSEIASAVGGGPAEQVALAGALGPAEQAQEWLEHLRHIRLEIDGGDLIAAGIPEGPAIGRALRAALHAKLDGIVSGRDQELAEALRAAR
jgi:tRNA nucleotidyltransferase (CCA-adding enzyme)